MDSHQFLNLLSLNNNNILRIFKKKSILLELNLSLSYKYHFLSQSFAFQSCDKSDREVRENSADSGNEVTTKSLRAGLLALTTSELPYNHPEALLIAKESLLPSHHPHVCKYDEFNPRNE